MEFGGHHTPLRSPEAGVSQFESVGQRLAAPAQTELVKVSPESGYDVPGTHE